LGGGNCRIRSMERAVFIVVFVGFLVMNFRQEADFRRRGLEVDGARPVGPRLFKAGKLSLLFCWLGAALQAAGLEIRMVPVPPALAMAAAGVFLVGFGILAAAYRDLGDANKTGLPAEKTALRTGGIYAYSRNPLYLGLYFMTLGAVLYAGCAVVLALGCVAVFSHHRSVLAEEKFLAERFGAEYEEYKRRVRRYL